MLFPVALTQHHVIQGLSLDTTHKLRIEPIRGGWGGIVRHGARAIIWHLASAFNGKLEVHPGVGLPSIKPQINSGKSDTKVSGLSCEAKGKKTQFYGD